MSIIQEQERFFNMMTRLRGSNSRAASVPKNDVVVTEVINGVITSRPAKKTTYLNDNESEPEIIELTKSKGGSIAVPVNKLREIIRFHRSNGRL